MIRRALKTFSGLELPPTSRKFAGLAPKYLIKSMVAMASPAPLTMQPIVPSSPTNDRPVGLRLHLVLAVFLRASQASSSGCLNKPLSSKITFASAATSLPSAVSAHGFISTSEQSLSVNIRYIPWMIFQASSA